MQTRSFHLILAALVLTNPICCQMFGSTETVRLEEPVEECCGCACDREPVAQKESTPNVPCECPNCDLCQCVCAGAVVKDAVTVDHAGDDALVDVILERPIDAPSIPPHSACSCDAQLARAGANVGRSARLRFASLLC